MKRYELFSEYNDQILWGNDLVDALSRQKKIQKRGHFDIGTQKHIPGEIVEIKSILGTRDTSSSRRGNWEFESAVCETESGQIIEVDARVIGELK